MSKGYTRQIIDNLAARAEAAEAEAAEWKQQADKLHQDVARYDADIAAAVAAEQQRIMSILDGDYGLTSFKRDSLKAAIRARSNGAGSEMSDSQAEQRPESATDEVLEYLDDLRDSGATNMFGAAQYLEVSFGYDRQEAKSALLYWMHTFSDRHGKR